ncbi:DUF1572 family protein [Phycisphaeraceae bacterium D3-23]
MTDDLGTVVLASARETFVSQRGLADRAIAQVSFAQLRQVLDRDGNSVAVIMKHMAGNMRSRWTQVLTSDGEKPWRHRDTEFVDDYTDRDALEKDWASGWSVLLETLDRLTGDDLARDVYIRSRPLTLARAIHRQIAHYGYHVGQIVSQCKRLAGDDWAYLSVPRGGSEAYTRSLQTPKEHGESRGPGENTETA